MTLYGVNDMPNTNGVYVGGPIEPDEGTVYTGLTVVPGRVVSPTSTAGIYVESTTGATHIAGYACENLFNSAENLLTAYTAGQHFRINRAPGARFMGTILANSAALVYKDKLKTAVGGKLEKFVEGTDDFTLYVASYMAKTGVTPGGTDSRHIVGLKEA